jgi:serine/threonine protein phosphatase PrpC
VYIKCRTDIGKVRDINEDYVLTHKGDKYDLLIVADGMGGHNAGEIASKIAAVTIRNFIFEEFNNYEDKEELIRDAAVKANNEVYFESQRSDRLKGMGTTVTCCLIYGEKMYVGHVGDSRAYLINENGITKVTEDHSFVQELIKNGSITENEALKHPQRNLITRAVGTEKYVIVDTKVIDIKNGDIVIMCTDGLTSYVTNDEIFDIVINFKENSIDKLIDMAKERGGKDNISIIVARKGEKNE